MGDPIFGVNIREITEGGRPIIGADLSTVGLIGPAADADPAKYPLNTPVRIYSNDTTMTAALGTKGYLADAVRGVNDQLDEMQFAARIVVVRTADGVDTDPAIRLQKTINNIVGSSTSKTGIHAFLKSVGITGVTPRLIMAPGYTGQMANSVGTLELTSGQDGEGYIEGQEYTVNFSGGGTNAVQAEGTAIGQADGTLGPVTLTTPGAWYSTPPTVVADSAGQRVTVADITTPGSGYVVGDTINLGNGTILTVMSVSTSPAGAVLTVEITEPGLLDVDATAPTNPVAQVSTTGAGTGATFDLSWTDYAAAAYTATVSEGGNPVCVALPGVLNQLLAHAVVESSGTSQTDDENWRETISSKRLIPVSGGVRVQDPDTSTIVFRPFAPRVIGVGVRRDQEKGAPFHSWANQPIYGIVGPYRDITYNLTDDANEAQQLLKNNIGVIARGELGNEFAIAQAGFIFIGTDNGGEDEEWRFYNMTRGRDWIHLSLLRAMRFYLGRFNVTIQTVNSIVDAMRMLLRDIAADGHILGYKITFAPDKNTSDEVRSGHITIGFKAEEAAPLRRITIESARYREAVDAMISELSAQMAVAA